jgi:integrase
MEIDIFGTKQDEEIMLQVIKPITAKNPLDRCPAAVYLATLSPGARRTMGFALNEISQLLSPTVGFFFPWWEIRYQHTQAIRQYLIERNKPATVNRKLAALRGVLKQTWLLGFMSAEDYHKAAAVKSVKNEVLPAGREISVGEIAAIFKVCENDSALCGIRDAAIIACLYGCGLRRAEVVSLNIEDYNQETGELKVNGKGNKERIAWITNGAKRAFDDWLDIRGEEQEPLFVPILKGERFQFRSMTTQAIYKMLKKRAGQAGVKHFSPHDLRRTFVSHLLAAGEDISIVAKMAGHSSTQTTARYDRRGEVAKRKAAGKLHVPYVGR